MKKLAHDMDRELHSVMSDRSLTLTDRIDGINVVIGEFNDLAQYLLSWKDVERSTDSPPDKDAAAPTPGPQDAPTDSTAPTSSEPVSASGATPDVTPSDASPTSAGPSDATRHRLRPTARRPPPRHH